MITYEAETQLNKYTYLEPFEEMVILNYLLEH